MTVIRTESSDQDGRTSNLWVLMLVRGIIAIALGATALFWPEITISVLFMIFGIFIIIDGVVALGIALFARRTAWGGSVFQGIAGIVIGVLVLRFPETAAALIVVLLALWALVIGLFQVVLALRLRGAGAGSWIWALVSGLVTTLLGLYLLINPQIGAQLLAMALGAFAILSGAVLVFGAFQLRRHRGEVVTVVVE